ncbi:hypothetical protein EOD41_10595 [Mucilaginibacter limnophilus]|uniref:Outer membrane protein beta-barrel domain-containing protein n=1 Tax=Mucilaginibacter limnophilus TaxID=1932778 RepID=A0A437MTQ8_9SPHI|nr:hypothetical protein [Mucilaginibacter limnophilus]RVU01055.1 hypothetical protein EOD41_10595 [Mucilaginibacter limnophilus]
MKKTTKLLAAALTAVAIFVGSNANAQTSEKSAWRLGFGLEGGIPTGDIKDYSSFQLGGTARLQYGLSDNLALTLTSGYYNFFGKEVEIAGDNYDAEDVGIIPVKLGIKAFFTDNLYFGAEAGAGFATNEGNNTKLILAPALGWADQHWDFGVKYENFSGNNNNWGVVGLRVAYGFGL